MFVEKSPGQPTKSLILVTDFLFLPAFSGNRKRVASLMSAIRSWGYAVHVIGLDTGFSDHEISATRAAVDQLELVSWRPQLDPYGLPAAKTFSERVAKKLQRGLLKSLGKWPPPLNPDLEDRCPAHFRAAVRERVEKVKPA